MIGKVPPIQPMGIETVLPQANIVAIDYRQDRALPDHYPLVTPQGRFEVHELADRGLYSQARYAPYPYDDYEAELARAELEAAYEAETEPRAAAIEPLELAEGPASLPRG